MANPAAKPPAKLPLPVEVIGADLDGQQFFEVARILTIHRNGGSLLLANKLAPDCELLVRNPETNEEAIAFVMGQIREERADHIYALAFLDPNADLWQMHSTSPAAAKSILLECSGCQSVCSHSLTGIELELFEARKELARFCTSCKSSRLCRATTKKPNMKEPLGPREQNPIPSSTASSMEEKRKNRRTRMKMTACVRYSGLEEVVACEDISKGGFRFIGRKEYRQGTRVEVSVPYTKSSNNMFSLASIAYSVKLPDGQFRHGVRYTKTSGSIGWDENNR